MTKTTIELERHTVVETDNGTPLCAISPSVDVMDRVMQTANEAGLKVYHHAVRGARQVLSTRTVADPVRSYDTYAATMTERTVEYVWFVDIYLQ
jgi:hypothetical protein